MTSYAALWNKSYYSFLEGASAPEELVERANELQIEAIGITDRNGVYGLAAAHVAAVKEDVKIIAGSEVSIDDGTSIVLLAQDREGYANLCRLVTVGQRRSPKGEFSVSWGEVAEYAEGVIGLWGGQGSLLVREEFSDGVAGGLKEALGDRLYAVAARHLRCEEKREEKRLRERAKKWQLPIVAGVEVLYHTRKRRQLQDVLTCIKERTSVGEAGNLLRPNDRYVLTSPKVFARLFNDDPLAVTRTIEVADRCSFTLAELRYRYPSERLPEGKTSAQWLEHLVRTGAQERFGNLAIGGAIPTDLQQRVDRELELIHGLDYDGYFLTMWEIVQFCRQEGILCQGRGSAANSVACYCLGITAVNPREVDLLFERFISRERAEPPDIDLDIEHNRREEVIQHVYQKYGRDKAAMVANVVRFRPKSAIREVGKALGLPEVNLDRMAKMASFRGSLSAEELQSAGFDTTAPLYDHLIRLVEEIQNFPRHLSVHPGGFLLGHEPVHDFVPVENATMADRTVIQWDKYDVEALGLFKVDLLGLGALNQLHLAFDLLKDHRGLTTSLAQLPREDKATFNMLGQADTVGVFQVESRAQMNMLPRLRPRTYYDMVIEVAIVRPGPITGGMVHPYINRRHGIEEITYPHPLLEPVLRKTLGVPLFQEQVMRLAMIAADYTPGEADQLRRDMATWRRNGPIEGHHQRLVSRMMNKGITEEFAERVFAQIKGFGEYGFPESHAASFALIAYATAWLKCHFHAEFTCALLNAYPMGFYSPGTLVEDAKRHGITVRPIDITRSLWDCTLEEADADRPAEPAPSAIEQEMPASWKQRPLAIRMGLRYVKGLGREEGINIVAGQLEKPYRSIADLARRTRLPDNMLVALAESGALDSFQKDRRQALWQIHGLSKQDRPEQLTLPLDQYETEPELEVLSDMEQVNWDWRRGGHSARGHLLKHLRPDLQFHKLPDARQVSQMRSGTKTHYVGIVICRQRPGTANNVTFMTMEDETGFVNLVVWADVFTEFRVLIKTLSLMGVSGKIQAEEGVIHLIVDRVWEPRLDRVPEKTSSRDFH